MAYLTLDTDLDVAGVKPNVALTMGAWWPKFGVFSNGIYDTYMFGRFHLMGEQIQLTVPLTSEITATVVQGFGAGRDGSSSTSTALDLVDYQHVDVTYRKDRTVAGIGLHYNNSFTADPSLDLTATSSASTSTLYSDARQAGLSVAGAEVNVNLPVARHLWVSPTYLSVTNGFALANGGTEVMHSLGGSGIASNYMGWTGNMAQSTGSGSMVNLGFLYENQLSNIMGQVPGTSVPDVTLNVFGMLADVSRNLPSGSTGLASSLKQFKWGASATVQTTNWLAFMLRSTRSIWTWITAGTTTVSSPRARLSRRTSSPARTSGFSTGNISTATISR